MDKNKAETKAVIKKKLSNKIKGLSKKFKIITVAIIAFVIIFSAIIIVLQNQEGEVTTVSESSLQKVLEISELSTVDYTYNATVAQYSKNTGEVMYYVAYEGTVTAGVDFSKIDTYVNDAEKTVTVTIPNVEIHDILVDVGTLEYIFVKDKYETETISQEAYKLCKDDLKKRIEKEDLLYKTAKENAVSSVEALLKPWIETIDKEYKVEIK